MKKKRLLVTASTFPRWEGDTEPRFVLDLSKAMSDYFEITVLAPAAPGAKDKEKLEGIDVIRYHYFPVHAWETLCYPGAIVPRIKEKKIRVLLVPFLVFALWLKLFKMVDEYDMVLAHWIIPQGIVQSLFKVPYVVTGLGGDVSSLNNCFVKKMKVATLKKAKQVIVVSEELKKQVQEYFNSNNIAVISMGCDTEKFTPKNRINNFFEQDEKKVILFVGRLVEKKGARYFIEAAQNIDAKFVIVGDGPLRETLMRQAAPLGDRIVFLGSKTQEELTKIYASADILVAPSITAQDGDKEGLPTAIIEAMASGLPIIGSDSGGIKEIVHNQENGILVQEKNTKEIVHAISLLMENKQLYTRMRTNAVKTAEMYDYKYKAKQYADIINEG